MPTDLTGKWLARERLNRGYTLLGLGQTKLAEAEFLAGVKIVPDDPQLNYFLGWVLDSEQRFNEAKPYLQKSVARDPDNVSYQIQLGRAYAMGGEPEKGIKIFEQVLAENPQEITACIDIAKTYELILKSDEAYFRWLECWAMYKRSPAAFKPMQEEISSALQRTKK